MPGFTPNPNYPGYAGHDKRMEEFMTLPDTPSPASRSRDAASMEHERARLREIVAQHRRDDGVWFDSRAWIVSA